jgi:hypothetical protein
MGALSLIIVFFYFFSVIGGEITWRASHQYYIDSFRSLLAGSPAGGLHPVVFIFLIIGGEYFLFYLWRRFYVGEKKIDTHLSPFLLLLLFSFFFFIIAFGWFGFYHLNPDSIMVMLLSAWVLFFCSAPLWENIFYTA